MKILVSGGGRCNLTTTVTGPALEAAYGAVAGRWLRHALRAYPPAALRAAIEAAGVPLKEEALEKVFPVSDRAADVLAALLRRGRGRGCAPGLRAAGHVRSTAWARASAPKRRRGRSSARTVVLASGGRSYPQMGTTGDGYRLAATLGHTVTPTLPALAPLALSEPWVHALAGLGAADCALALVDRAGRVLARRRRPLLFTHQGLSGPGPMDLSGWVEEAGPGSVLTLDFLPALTREALDAALRAGIATGGRRQAWTLLPESAARAPAPRPRRAGRRDGERGGARPRGPRAPRRSRSRTCASPWPAASASPRRRSRAAASRWTEVDARTMASRVAPGLFICGELLDVDGPIGGYNFQAAFATGRLAGLNA